MDVSLILYTTVRSMGLHAHPTCCGFSERRNNINIRIGTFILAACPQNYDKGTLSTLLSLCHGSWPTNRAFSGQGTGIVNLFWYISVSIYQPKWISIFCDFVSDMLPFDVVCARLIINIMPQYILLNGTAVMFISKCPDIKWKTNFGRSNKCCYSLNSIWQMIFKFHMTMPFSSHYWEHWIHSLCLHHISFYEQYFNIFAYLW